MIEKVTNLIDRLPDNGKFGKLISILALMMVGYYTDPITGERREVSTEEMSYLNSIIFYQTEGTVQYRIISPSNNSNKILICCLGCSPVEFLSNDHTSVIKVCDNLGFYNPMDYMSFEYSLSSNIMILKNAKKEA